LNTDKTQIFGRDSRKSQTNRWRSQCAFIDRRHVGVIGETKQMGFELEGDLPGLVNPQRLTEAPA
jgi:hypothetical protein